MLQTIRKAFLTRGELALVELAEKAETIYKETCNYTDTYSYNVKLKCSSMKVDSDGDVRLDCGNNVTSSRASKTFVYCIGYLWANDRKRRVAKDNAEQAEKLKVDIDKFLLCAQNCKDKK